MGRPKGSRNQANRETKIAWAHFCKNNIDKFQELFDKVEEEDGAAAALRLLLDISKYAAPIAKDEDGSGDGKIVIQVNTGIHGPPNSIKPITNREGGMLLTEDGKPIYESDI